MALPYDGKIVMMGDPRVESGASDSVAPAQASNPSLPGSTDVTFSAIAIRSLFPLVALVLILGTFAWGPWVTLGATYLWWRIVGRIG